LRTSKLSNEVIEIILSSCSDGTWRQYSSHINKWSIYCKDNNVDLFSSGVNDILSFLVQLFQNKLSYSSINTARSALSMICTPVNGTPVGQDLLVLRFMKGISKKRPAVSRYSVTWDANRVLQLFKSWSDNENLSLENLTLKLVGLLALVTAQRVQTLSLIVMSNIMFDESVVKIMIKDLIKTSKVGVSNPVLILPSYEVDPKICVVKTLNEYMKRTKDVRKSNKLLISYAKPHNCV